MKLPNSSANPVSRRVFTFGALSVVTAAALSACGGGDKPADTASPSASDLAAGGAGTITMWVDAERAPRIEGHRRKVQDGHRH